MAKDQLQVLQIFLTSCDFRNIAPARWHWEHKLFSTLELLDARDYQLRLRAMLVCLILSAATTDDACIECTGELHKAGLLDFSQLATASVETIIPFIKKCGIQNQRAQYLKDTAKMIMSAPNNGMVPSTYKGLMALPGVARKTTILMLNEGFGFFAGIGTDKHVMEGAKCFGFWYDETTKNKDSTGFTSEHVESSLREWIGACHHKDVNKIFGSFAQLFTQELSSIKTEDQRLKMFAVLRALGDFISMPYHLELFWFMVKKLRAHYDDLDHEN